jgi:hypothetical protein
VIRYVHEAKHIIGRRRLPSIDLYPTVSQFSGSTSPNQQAVSALTGFHPRRKLRHSSPGALGPASRRWRRYADVPAGALLTGLVAALASQAPSASLSLMLGRVHLPCAVAQLLAAQSDIRKR